MSEESIPYYVVYAGTIAGETKFGSQKVISPVALDNEEIIHLRPSGNAPELRCYNEAATAERTAELNVACMKILETWR